MFGIAVLNDTIVVCGGALANSNATVLLDSCEQFAITNASTGDGRWSLMPALPYPTAMLGMAAAEGKVYAIGGLNGTGFHLDALDTRSDTTSLS